MRAACSSAAVPAVPQAHYLNFAPLFVSSPPWGLLPCFIASSSHPWFHTSPPPAQLPLVAVGGRRAPPRHPKHQALSRLHRAPPPHVQQPCILGGVATVWPPSQPLPCSSPLPSLCRSRLQHTCVLTPTMVRAAATATPGLAGHEPAAHACRVLAGFELLVRRCALRAFRLPLLATEQ